MTTPPGPAAVSAVETWAVEAAREMLRTSPWMAGVPIDEEWIVAILTGGQVSAPGGAAAMREAAAKVCERHAGDFAVQDSAKQPRMKIVRDACTGALLAASRSIRALPALRDASGVSETAPGDKCNALPAVSQSALALATREELEAVRIAAGRDC